MNKSSLRNTIIILSLAVIAILIPSCDEGDLGLAKGFVGSSTYTSLIDSVSIRLSTIKFDSVQTSGRESGLVGYTSNPLSGGQKAISYFSITKPESFSWDDDKEVIDSIAFIFTPNGYSIGDTTSTMSFQLHQLDEEIELNESGYLNNIDSVAYIKEPLATKDYVVWPNEGKSISIKLDNQFAEELITYMQTNKNEDDYTNMFQEEFKGFALLTDTTITNSIIGVYNDDDNTKLKIYSHVVNLEKEENETEFLLRGSTYHFTQVQELNTPEPWSELTSSNIRLSETETGSQCLMQNTKGYFIRIDFPFLNNLMEIKEQGRIVKAQLILRPVSDYVSNTDLPETFYISTINKVNALEEYLYNSSGDLLTPTLVTDNLYNENTYYSIDITSYLNTRIQETIIDTNQGLALVFPDADSGTKLDYMVLGGHYHKEFKSQLYIYYYYYDI